MGEVGPAHDLDREMLALRACLEALLGIDEETTRRRILNYLNQRFPCRHHGEDDR